MNNLKLIENELVPVYETDSGEKVVYGMELHSVLVVKSKFADWVKNRLNDCDATENVDFCSFSKILEKGGRPQTEYLIKLDIAKEMAMLERNDKGKQVRRYFIQIEKKYKAAQEKLSLEDMMRIQLGMLDESKKQMSNHESRIENLENNMTIDYGQQRVLEDTVNKTVIDILGGKESYAYEEIGRKVFAECNRDLKHYFNVNARNNVPKKRFDEAVEYAKNWKPCTNTMMLICSHNAQMRL
ncbi:MAG: hypothetical protein HFH74_02270 [Lachnospiraceae bacterium]|jgi:phage anti-repressor protein|nr:hypothetical protein [Lachnospiraceae bacterium]